MKDKIKFVILLIVFIVILISLYIIMNILNKDLEKMKKSIEKQTSTNSEIIIENQENNNIENIVVNNENFENMVNNDIEVIEVTEETFDEEVLKSEKTVLIDFYADWCGPCKILSPIVEEIAKENPDIKVVKVDVDNNASLSYKYNANYIPLLVVIKDGQEVDRAVGAIPKEEILDLVK